MYFKKRDGTIYSVPKEEIYKKINIYDPKTFMWLLKELDHPWIPKFYFIRLSRAKNKNDYSVLAKYIATMKLASFKGFGYKDSERFASLK